MAPGLRRRAAAGSRRGGRLGDHDGVVRGGAEEAEGAREVRGRLPLLVLAPELLPVPEERGGELLAQLRVLREELVRGLRERGGPDVRAAVRAAAVREPRRAQNLGRKRVIQVLFNMSVPRERVPEKAYMLRDRSER